MTRILFIVGAAWVGFSAAVFGAALLVALHRRKPAPHPVDCVICELYAERTPAPVEVVPA